MTDHKYIDETDQSVLVLLGELAHVRRLRAEPMHARLPEFDRAEARAWLARHYAEAHLLKTLQKMAATGDIGEEGGAFDRVVAVAAELIRAHVHDPLRDPDLVSGELERQPSRYEEHLHEGGDEFR
jgi:hypothetical protein